LNPNLDFTKKRQGAGGALPIEKQVGRPVEIDLDEGEVFVNTNLEPAIPNDPSRPRVRGVSLEKLPERFKYVPEDDPSQKEELVLPAEVKPLPEPKTLISFAKAAERFPSKERDAPIDLSIMKTNPNEFHGIDLADVTKAYKATKTKESVPNFDHYSNGDPTKVA
jgi:hypothetical protein